MALETRNPVLNGIEQKIDRSASYVSGKTASFAGIATKTGILLAIIFGISAYIWINLESLIPSLMGLLIGGMIVGFIAVLLSGLIRSMTPFFTIVYAIAEGLVLGTLTAVISVQAGLEYLPMNAVVITFAIFAFLLIGYSTGLIKVGFRFRKFVYTATFAVAIYFMIAFLLSSFTSINLFATSPGLVIIIVLAMVLLASFNLLVDFDNCKIAVDRGVSSRDEWYLSLGLLVSLVWLYIEVLRLLLIVSRYFKD